MAIKIKAIEKEIKVGKYQGTYRYCMQPELYIALATEKVIREAALRSGVSKGVMQACWDAAGEVIKAWATEGHSVALPGLGTMRFGVRAKSVDNVNDVKSSLIQTRRIVFTPNQDLKDELANTSIQITCYDRNGELVKRVTSTSGTVEDTSNQDTTDDNGDVNNGSGSENNGSGSGSEQGGSGSDNNGSGSENNGSEQSGSGDNNSQTESVAAPTINGDSPFAESTEVTLTGPDGAEIHYTTDGSDPTAQSTLYSEAFTLTEAGTVKAIAIKDGVSSEIASRYFTKSSGGGGGFESGD